MNRTPDILYETLDFRWRISGFHLIGNVALKSSEFQSTPQNLCPVEVQLTLQTEQESPHIFLQLNNVRNVPVHETVAYITLMTSESLQISSFQSNGLGQTYALGTMDFLRNEIIDNALVIKVYVELDLLWDELPANSRPIITCLEYLLHMCTVRKDFSLVVDEHEVKIQLCVLAARSTFFDQLYKRDRSTTSYTFPDVSFQTVQSFVHFCYFGRITGLNMETVRSWVQFAKMYGVADLKSYVINFLQHAISLQTAVNLYELSCECDLPLLKDSTVVFIRHNRQRLRSRLLDLTSRRPTEFECLMKML